MYSSEAVVFNVFFPIPQNFDLSWARSLVASLDRFRQELENSFSKISTTRISAVGDSSSSLVEIAQEGSGAALSVKVGASRTEVFKIDYAGRTAFSNAALWGTINAKQRATSGQAAEVLRLERVSTDAHLYVSFDSTNLVWRIGASYTTTGSYHPLQFWVNDAARLHVATTSFYPVTDNYISCGASGQRWSAVYAANGTIQTSDARLKTDVKDSCLGLDFICSLRPVSYRWIEGGREVRTERIPADNADGWEVKTTESALPGKRQHFGFIAQEVAEALAGQDFGGFVVAEDGVQSLRYDQFISPLTKAVQELAARVTSLEQRLADCDAVGGE